MLLCNREVLGNSPTSALIWNITCLPLLQANVTEVPEDQLIGQWASCSGLGGLSVSEVVPGYAMMDPNIPEFCAYVRIILGLPSELATLPPDLAKGVYRSLQLPDTAGLLALSTHVDPAVLALLQVRRQNLPSKTAVDQLADN